MLKLLITTIFLCNCINASTGGIENSELNEEKNLNSVSSSNNVIEYATNKQVNIGLLNEICNVLDLCQNENDTAEETNNNAIDNDEPILWCPIINLIPCKSESSGSLNQSFDSENYSLDGQDLSKKNGAENCNASIGEGAYKGLECNMSQNYTNHNQEDNVMFKVNSMIEDLLNNSN